MTTNDKTDAHLYAMNYLDEEWKRAIEDSMKKIQDAFAIPPPIVGELRYTVDPNYNPYAAFHEFGRPSEPSSIIDSTATVIEDDYNSVRTGKRGSVLCVDDATVIEENVKALPSPEVNDADR